jgi:hypothetical protein
MRYWEVVVLLRKSLFLTPLLTTAIFPSAQSQASVLLGAGVNAYLEVMSNKCNIFLMNAVYSESALFLSIYPAVAGLSVRLGDCFSSSFAFQALQGQDPLNLGVSLPVFSPLYHSSVTHVANISIPQKDQDLNYAATAYPTIGYSTNEIQQNLMNVSISAINVIMIIVFSLAVGQACKERQQPSEV